MPSNTADECSERIRSCVNSMRPTNSLLHSSPWQTFPAQASYACGRTWRHRRFGHSRHRAETNHRVTFATESYLYLIHYRTAQLFVNTGSYFSQTRKATRSAAFPQTSASEALLASNLVRSKPGKASGPLSRFTPFTPRPSCSRTRHRKQQRARGISTASPSQKLASQNLPEVLTHPLLSRGLTPTVCGLPPQARRAAHRQLRGWRPSRTRTA